MSKNIQGGKRQEKRHMLSLSLHLAYSNNKQTLKLQSVCAQSRKDADAHADTQTHTQKNKLYSFAKPTEVKKSVRMKITCMLLRHFPPVVSDGLF